MSRQVASRGTIVAGIVPMETNQTPDIAEVLNGIDTKLDALNGIDSKLVDIQTGVRTVTGLADTVTTLQTQMLSLEKQVTSLDTKVTSLDTKVTALDTKVTALDTKVADVQTGLINLSIDMKGRFVKVDRQFKSMAAQIEMGRAEIVSHIDRVYDEVAARLKDVEGPRLH
jgi:uncharacterized phage infection (PIP) family protein YhgE